MAIAFDRQPHLVGDLVELRPLRPDDWEVLFAVASDPLIWAGHPERDRYTEPVFREYFRGAIDSGGALAVLDRATGQIIGSSRYHWREGDELEIGWTFLARAYWGGIYNREMKRLMLDYAFQFVNRVVFVVGVNNIRSRTAMLKIGGVLTDRRVTETIRGMSLESVVFEITKQDLHRSA